MKHLIKSLAAIAVFALISCGGKEEKKESDSLQIGSQPQTEAPAEQTSSESSVPPSQRVDFTTKGVGPVTSVTLGDEIDQAMADKGKEVYDANCLACHKPTRRFIGPAPQGILERRTPEWIMNMILDPERMVVEDPLAKELLI